MRGFVVLTFKFHKEGKRWVAYCEELGTATFGRFLQEAESRLKEAVELHLNTLEDVGERERFFAEHNIQLYSTKPRGSFSICVPATEGTYTKPYIRPIGSLTPVHA